MYPVVCDNGFGAGSGHRPDRLLPVRPVCEPDVAGHAEPDRRGLSVGGTAMFALMALGGDLGCSIGPQLTGIIADQSSLNLGLLAAVVFPAVMLIGLMVLKPMLFPKHGADSPQQ